MRHPRRRSAWRGRKGRRSRRDGWPDRRARGVEHDSGGGDGQQQEKGGGAGQLPAADGAPVGDALGLSWPRLGAGVEERVDHRDLPFGIFFFATLRARLTVVFFATFFAAVWPGFSLAALMRAAVSSSDFVLSSMSCSAAVKCSGGCALASADRSMSTCGAYEVRDIFRDAYTGTDADRPEFNLMCERILKNGVRTILIEDLSRLARDLTVQQLLLAKLADLGISLIVANTGQDVTNDVAENPMLKAMVQIAGVFAELEKANLVGKLRHARDAKAADLGKCEGAKFYGEVDAAEKATVALMRDLRRKRSGKRLGFAGIAAALNAQGIKPRRGAKWYATTVSNILNRKGRKGAA